MAKKTWEGFSGLTWEALGEAERAAFVSQAPSGPRALIRAVLTSDALRDARLPKTTTVSTTQPVRYDWAADIAPLVAQSCAGAACHGADNARGPASAYAESEARFKTADAGRVASGSMPPPGSGVALSAADRAKILLFLGAAGTP